MASITTADFRNGMGLKIKDKYYTIVEFQHVKPGKGGAFVRYKTKDLKTGRVVENTCNAGSKFESVQLITNEMQYLYNDGDNYYFMDMTSYEQLGVNPPMFIEAEVVETVPGAKGNTVQGATKPATIDTGAVVQVPMYLNEGERIKVDTRTGEFVQRL